MVFLAIIVLSDPNLALLTFVYLIAFGLLLWAIATIVVGIFGRLFSPVLRELSVGSGLIALVVAIVVLFVPELVVDVLLVLLALVLLVVGMAEIMEGGGEAPEAPTLEPEAAAIPAEPPALCAMNRGEHPPERGEVAARLELEEFHQQVCDAAGGAMRNRLGRGAACCAQRGEAVGLGGEGIGEAGIVHLEEHCAPGEHAAVAAVDAAAADRPGISDAQVSRQCADQPEVRRVFARLRRSTRMPMKARSNLLRQETLACSRSATRTRSRRDPAPAVTVAPRCWPLSER